MMGVVEEVRVPVSRSRWVLAGKGRRGRMGTARVRRMAWVPQPDGEMVCPGWRVVWRRKVVASIVPVTVDGAPMWRIEMAGEYGPAEGVIGKPWEFWDSAVIFAVWAATGELR